ncbi:lipase secretion chaperone [Duganella callida]|uniref:Lipase helper protein n=1 Tax=Duganella callida TaxID=2561932 RepID=A0A4Y9SIW5_9BURK|nr:lipase secretion chaperone [Duganella callida]TFW25567.1 lipase chaperone [Duganella callida]
MKALARLAAVAALAYGAWLWAARSEAPVATTDMAPTRHSAADYFAFVRSAAGTRPDGDVRAHGDRLEVTPELAYLFDYYLAGLGERPLASVRAEIIRELERRLRPAAAAEALRLLDAYLAYKRALVDVERGLPSQTDAAMRARQRLTAAQQLRRQYFSDTEIAGLFAAGDTYDMDAIARLEIGSDAGLSPGQRQQRIAALDAALPQQAREERAAPMRVIRLEDAVAKARAQGADDNDIYRMRAAVLSPAAAARLAEVDREEIDWQRRITAYQAQRRELQQNADNEAALQQLRAANFTPDEQKRLPAYE